MEFGVVGCGRIAQMMHLPHLASIPGAEIGAIADPAPAVLSGVGERYSVDRRYRDSNRLIADAGADLDAVVVATPPEVHADVTVAALEAGLHTLVEKPIALTVEDADRMVAAAETVDATAMVGYMKRHDPTYLEMRERVTDLETVNRVVGTLVLGQHDEGIREMYDLVRGDPPDDIVEESNAARSDQIEQAIGSDDPAVQASFFAHLGASSSETSSPRSEVGSTISSGTSG